MGHNIIILAIGLGLLSYLIVGDTTDWPVLLDWFVTFAAYFCIISAIIMHLKP